MTTQRARKVNRSGFGSVRELPSGRWQARYPDPNTGALMAAPRTFINKREALDHIAEVQADRNRGVWIDPRRGERLFGEYAAEWVEQGGTRGKLAPRTRELYSDILRRQLDALSGATLAGITPARVRRWYADTKTTLASASPPGKGRGGHPARAWALQRGMPVAPTGRLSPELLGQWRAAGAPVPAAEARPVSARRGEARLGQAYRLLHAILATATSDGLIASNPCRIVGAGSVRDPERPYLAPEQLQRIVMAMGVEFDVPVRVMLGAHLRVGELIGLQRGDYDRQRGVLRVERQMIVIDNREVPTPTKTGETRNVPLPPSVAKALEAHIDSAAGFPRSPMFARSDGHALSRHALQRAWRKAVRSTGLTGYHLHDVRHTGLTLAAVAGATTRELMARAGHRTNRAAGIYQHIAEGRLTVLAERLDGLLGGGDDAPNGTTVAHAPGSGPSGRVVEGGENRA